MQFSDHHIFIYLSFYFHNFIKIQIASYNFIIRALCTGWLFLNKIKNNSYVMFWLTFAHIFDYIWVYNLCFYFGLIALQIVQSFWAFSRIFANIPRNLFEHSPESFRTFPVILLNIPRNFLEHSPESSWTFPGIFLNIPRNLLEHSPESFWTFPGIFSNIPRNLLEHSPESWWTFPGILLSIPRNLVEHSPESSWAFPGMLIPRIPRIPFPVPVFLVL